MGLGVPHLFDWDEINFAECAREMLSSGDYANVQIGFEPFREKPPLFFWLQALCMAIFGVNEFAARLPNALCGTATLLTIFFIGAKLKDHRFGLLWVLLFVASFLPHFYFKFGIIDPVFNLFIFLSLYQTILSIEERKFNKKNALFAGLFSGLAVLTKGPVGLLLLILTVGVYQVVTRFKRFPKLGYFLWFAVSFSLVVGSWFALNIIVNGWDLFWQFINYQIELFTQPVAGHKQPFYYHFLVVFLGCFPMSLYALPAFRSKVYTARSPYNFRLWMLSLFWVVMVLFTITTTKIVHYSSMAYLPLSFLAAIALFRLEEKHRSINKVLNTTVLIFSLLFGVLLTALPFVFQKKDKWIHLLSKDPFAQASFNLPVDWPWWICIAGLLFIIASILGFVWRQNNKFYPALAVNALGTGIVLISLFLFVLPRIERYTQGPAIDFMAEKAGSNAYVTTYGYKSYANFFYFKYPNQADKQTDDANYLLSKPMDKPVYLVAKCTNKELDSNPNVKLIGQTGGFKFYEKVNMIDSIVRYIENDQLVKPLVIFHDFITYNNYRKLKNTSQSNIIELGTREGNIDTAAAYLYGKIIDYQSKQPIVGATIKLQVLGHRFWTKDEVEKLTEESNDHIFYTRKTNTDGKFDVGMPLGLFRFEIKANGYTSYIDTLAGGIESGEVHTMTFGLKHK